MLGVHFMRPAALRAASGDRAATVSSASFGVATGLRAAAPRAGGPAAGPARRGVVCSLPGPNVPIATTSEWAGRRGGGRAGRGVEGRRARAAGMHAAAGTYRWGPGRGHGSGGGKQGGPRPHRHVARRAACVACVLAGAQPPPRRARPHPRPHLPPRPRCSAAAAAAAPPAAAASPKDVPQDYKGKTAVIVGAGPAGSTAAMFLARRGFKVGRRWARGHGARGGRGRRPAALAAAGRPTRRPRKPRRWRA
jgi:hypothetical protein